MGTTRLRVELSPEARSYDIVIRNGTLAELGGGGGSLSLPHASSYFIITDSNVGTLYGRKLRATLSELDHKVEIVSFPAGERNKNIRTSWMVASRLSKLGADRESVILALGGGVVGDLAGFVASIYKRGIGYVQLPTTLLAQVDSSIGGKTGVDAPWGKNQLGAFYQPLGVVTDPSVLGTLPPSEMMNGLGEIVKCAIIAEPWMFESISSYLEKFDSRIPTDLIVGACRVKADVVSKDEKERDLRAILNYGHTVGHAIESSSNYRLGHGACVVVGMLAEGWIALQLGILQKGDFEKQSELLLRMYGDFGVKLHPLNKGVLLRFALADKKTTSSSLRMSLPEGLGRMHVTEEGSHKIPVSAEVFKQSIDYLREVLPSSG